ncbi:MAG: BolA family transcriptional regulator [Gammaproteobacteria bacterium]|nr:BolA family transcriptional regulator [Gammaproteobacteria bacterium]
MITSTRAYIVSRIQQAFAPSYLEVIDESDQHIGHAGHQGGGRHFAIIITADCLNGITRIEAHRKIYALFIDKMPDQIHALKIKVI